MNVISTILDIGSNASSTTYPTEQFAKESNESTMNAVTAVDINNQLNINALEAARENLKIYNKTIDAVIEYNTRQKALSLLFVSQQRALGY